MQILGGIVVVIGLIFCLTIIGAAIGIPLMLIGALLIYLGRGRTPFVIQFSNERRRSPGKKRRKSKK